MAKLGAGSWQMVSSGIEPDGGPGRFPGKKPTLGRDLGRWRVRIDRADDDAGRAPSADAPDAQEASPIRETPVTREVPDGDDAPSARGASDADGDGGRAVRVARALEYRATVDAAVRAHAIDKAYEKISEIERGTVTPAMKRIEAEDPGRRLAGLENRLKGKDRLAEKVTSHLKSNPELSVDQALEKVKDAIRYTFVYRDDHYTDGVQTDNERLADRFELIDRRNSWPASEYKGINTRWRVPENGQIFEVQFHTNASFEAKQFTHAAYEQIRDPATRRGERDKLQDFQRQVSAGIPVPPNVSGIPDYP